MVKETFTIQFTEGLHMRPASVLAKLAGKFACDVTLSVGEKNINAKSVVGLVAACIKCGTEIQIICDGEDEKEAMAEIKESIEAGLGEE